LPKHGQIVRNDPASDLHRLSLAATRRLRAPDGIMHAETFMLDKILGDLRHTSRPQVTRRRIIGSLKRTQLSRHEIGSLRFADPDSDINRASNQIDVLVSQIQINAHLRISSEEIEEDGSDEVGAKIRRRRDADQTAWLCLKMEHRVMRDLGLANNPIAVLEVQLARVGQLHTARRTIEERRSYVPFQFCDATGHGGMGNPKGFTGPSKA
jgi:hypothetical protein